jgi:hypothetical protein
VGVSTKQVSARDWRRRLTRAETRHRQQAHAEQHAGHETEHHAAPSADQQPDEPEVAPAQGGPGTSTGQRAQASQQFEQGHEPSH